MTYPIQGNTASVCKYLENYSHVAIKQKAAILTGDIYIINGDTGKTQVFKTRQTLVPRGYSWYWKEANGMYVIRISVNKFMIPSRESL